LEVSPDRPGAWQTSRVELFERDGDGRARRGTLPARRNPVWILAFTPDGRELVTNEELAPTVTV
jgi:hypothetical protein